MEIKSTRVYGLEESIVASGYPMLTKVPTEAEFNRQATEISIAITDNTSTPHIERAKKLGSSPGNSGHPNFLKGIIVQADVTAPQYWWMQAQRYHWFDIVSSQSKMHKILEGDFGYCEYTDETPMVYTAEIIKLHKDSCCSFEDVLANTPMGLETTARISTNYLQLKNMYQQRKNHRLYMWNTVFREFVESLEYTKELGVVN